MKNNRNRSSILVFLWVLGSCTEAPITPQFTQKKPNDIVDGDDSEKDPKPNPNPDSDPTPDSDPNPDPTPNPKPDPEPTPDNLFQEKTLALKQFKQGTTRGEDARVRKIDGNYYSLEWVGSTLMFHKSKSLLDPGVGKPFPKDAPRFIPYFVKSLKGVTYNKWYAFDVSLWECDCTDPYDQIDKWRKVKDLPFTGWSIDFEFFQPPSGPYKDRLYVTWAGADTPNKSWGFESTFIAEVLDLSATGKTLSTYDNNDANRIVAYRFDWTDVIVEGAGAVIKDKTVSLLYSGQGAKTSEYALGIALLKNEQDPTNPSNWIDYNRGQCDSDPNRKRAEFAKTKDVWGPGVARVVPSPDGAEDWMVYHSKVWDTYNQNGTNPGEQDVNNGWTRYIHMQKIGWKSVVCSGVTYNIPSLGDPVPKGTMVTSPSGDPGLTIRKVQRIEAEKMIPFGFIMGKSIQNMKRQDADQNQQAPRGYKTETLTVDGQYSKGQKMAGFDALASDQPDAIKRSGLIANNVQSATRLILAASSVNEKAAFDLYVNGTSVRTLSVGNTGGWDAFKEFSIVVAIPFGAEVKLVYEKGKHQEAHVDYIELRND